LEPFYIKKVKLSGPPCTCIKVEEQSRFTSKTARQSPTLAHPAVPLATGVMKISSVDKTNKIGCHGNVSGGIKKLISD